MVLSQTQIGIFGAIRGFPARKGASRTVDGVKQYTLYTEDDLELVGCYDENNNLVFKIIRLPKRDVLDTYTFPVKTGTSIPQADVDGIYNDFLNQQQAIVEEEEFREEVAQLQPESNVIREEVVDGQTLKITQYLNQYNAVRDVILDEYYQVEYPSSIGGMTVTQTLDEAEAVFDEKKEYILNVSKVFEDKFDYTVGDTTVQIIYQYYTTFGGTPKDDPMPNWRIEGMPFATKASFVEGDVLRYNGVGVDEPIIFGTISTDVENDLIILKEYVEIMLDPPQEEGVYVADGVLPIYSWGWYRDNSPDSPFSPFSKVRLVETYTVAQTDGRVMGVTDSDIFTIPSGAVRLVVKDGYRVILRLLTQEIGYWESHLPNIESDTLAYRTRGWMEIAQGEVFNQETNYTDTELIDVELVGGDSISIDIDSEVDGIGRFSVISNGKQIVKGAPRSIDNETFLVITEIVKGSVESTPSTSSSGETGYGGGGTTAGTGGTSGSSSGGGGSSSSTDNETQPMGWLPVVVAGVLILGIMYIVFAGGDE